MRNRIRKFVGTVFAFAFISVLGTMALGLVIKFSGLSPTVVAAENAAISMMSEIKGREESKLELERETNRAHAFGNL